MIISRIHGGVGNQMFCYAMGRALSLRHGVSDFLIDYVHDSSLNDTRYFALDQFDCPTLKEANSQQIKSLNLIKEKNFSFDKEMLNIKSGYLQGYWQSYKYFEDFKIDIIRDFQLGQRFLNKRILSILNEIKNSPNSVAIHFRRGDYLNSSHKIHGILPVNYYFEALNTIKRNIKNITKPIFRIFLFSDDIDTIKKEFYGSNLNIEYVSNVFEHDSRGNAITKDTSYEDLYLMSQCEHNIIANSSYSWWGAYLNRNPYKIVISPKQWFADKNMNSKTEDLIPKEWFRI